MTRRFRSSLIAILLFFWERILGAEDESSQSSPSEPRQTRRDLANALEEEMSGRIIEIWVPRNLERRLKAAIHRANASGLVAGWDGDQFFDLQDDLQTFLISTSEIGMKIYEIDDGVVYDETTGCPIGILPEGV